MEAFRREIVALKLEFRLDPAQSVLFHTLRGKTLAFTYRETPRVNGIRLDNAYWRLLGGPFVEAAVDSEQLILKYGKMRRTLDSHRLTVTSTP
jgi:hypothetical protein